MAGAGLGASRGEETSEAIDAVGSKGAFLGSKFAGNAGFSSVFGAENAPDSAQEDDILNSACSFDMVVEGRTLLQGQRADGA